ncbi:MAG: hypothetical protein PHF31_17005 [Methylobacter sp.]|nr:hypothetical protein [Methylobacter sp.]
MGEPLSVINYRFILRDQNSTNTEKHHEAKKQINQLKDVAVNQRSIFPIKRVKIDGEIIYA